MNEMIKGSIWPEFDEERCKFCHKNYNPTNEWRKYEYKGQHFLLESAGRYRQLCLNCMGIILRDGKEIKMKVSDKKLIKEVRK